MAKAAHNSYSPYLHQPRQSSTLPGHLGARRPVNVQPRCHLHAEPIQGKHLVQSFAVHREDHTILESDG